MTGIIDPRELNDLAEFAARGGIGQGVATSDCVAESPDQLMFIRGDTLVLLRDLGDILLASCEGVVGWMNKGEVEFDRIAGGSYGPNKGDDTHAQAQALALSGSKEEMTEVRMVEIPQTIIVVAPSPPRKSAARPSPSPPLEGVMEQSSHIYTLPDSDGSPGLAVLRLDKRISNPFELDSPAETPTMEHAQAQPQPLGQDSFFPQQDEGNDLIYPISESDHGMGMGISGLGEKVRDSVLSTTSSEAFGGIGGFMMGGASVDGRASLDDPSGLEELRDDSSPPGTSVETPYDDYSAPSSSHHASPLPSPVKSQPGHLSAAEPEAYSEFSRGSIYAAQNRFRVVSMVESENGDGAFSLVKAAMGRNGDSEEEERERDRRKPRPLGQAWSSIPIPLANQEDQSTTSLEEAAEPELDPITPKSSIPREEVESPFGTSIATLLRLRIQKERSSPAVTSIDDTPKAHVTVAVPVLPPRSSSRPKPAILITGATSSESVSAPSPPIVPARSPPRSTERPRELISPAFVITNEDASFADTLTDAAEDVGNDTFATIQTVSDEPSEKSTIIETPVVPTEVTFTAATPTSLSNDLPEKALEPAILLASPIPLDEAPTAADIKPLTPEPSEHSHHSSDTQSSSNNLLQPRDRLSPAVTPESSPRHVPWSQASPSSPHSIAATRQAVEASRATPEGSRTRAMTLVGRMEADLLAAKGPVPITFLIGGAGGTRHNPHPHDLGHGYPGRHSPSLIRRATSPLADLILVEPMMEEGRFPRPPSRSATAPLSPAIPVNIPIPIPPIPVELKESKPLPRQRSRSFSSVMAKAVGKGKRDKTPPPLKLNQQKMMPSSIGSIPKLPERKASFPMMRGPVAPATAPAPAVPAVPAVPKREGVKPATPTINIPQNTASSSTSELTSPYSPSAGAGAGPTTSASSLVSPSARSPSFTFSSRSKGMRKVSKTGAGPGLASPVSHKDYAEETVKADGMDFELVQPKKSGSGFLSPSSPGSTFSGQDYFDRMSPKKPGAGGGVGISRSETLKSDISGASSRSIPLPETDEWGFLKDQSPTPEMFQSRAAGSDHRAAEQKWLSIISTPLASQSQPIKKIRKLVLESGIPASLRGKVWAWFMASTMSARMPGLYDQLLEHDKGKADERLERDLASAYPDHSLFANPTSTGTTDLRNLLRAYSHFAPSGYSPSLPLIAGALLIHCVAEDAFWLLNGLVGNILSEYFVEGKQGLKLDCAVFGLVLAGSEPKLGKKFKDLGVTPSMFMVEWYEKVFLRCLPWPTALRVLDAVVSEGPRFLLIASLSILTLSRDRLMAQNTKEDMLEYLHNLPQDALLLPETFMRACAEVRFRDEDWKKLRGAVEKDATLRASA